MTGAAKRAGKWSVGRAVSAQMRGVVIAQERILRELAAGPRTSGQLALAIGRDRAATYRNCRALQDRGLIKRIDGTPGRGGIAVYALIGDDTAPPETSRDRAGRQPAGAFNQGGNVPLPDSRVDRDPCFKCGVRADLGCRHRAATERELAERARRGAAA